jgi:hypothetical protein
MMLGVNPRYTMFGDPAQPSLRHPANPRRVTFHQYWSDPQIMLERQLEHLEWCALNLFQDAEMGLPERWQVWPDFQNVYEAAAWGCPIQHFEDQVPDTIPAFSGEDGRRALLKAPTPDPFDAPFFRRVWAFYDHFKRREAEGFDWKGRPIRACPPSGIGTDGPFTVLCNLRGPVEVCMDLAEDPPAATALLEKVTDSIFEHVRAFRVRLGEPEKTEGWGFADDSIALLSTDMYARFVARCHRRLIQQLSSGGPNSIHLCGDATRHFPYLKETLNIMSFDTGFPVDFGEIRRLLGPDVEILGGPSVPLLRMATPAEVLAETRRILESGVMEGGRFVLREGNNLAPDVPVASVRAMYDAVREFGVYA